MLRVLDLFSGIGGFSLGLERTGGFQTVAFCEIEPFPRRVLAKHWPGVPIYEDVRKLTADTLARDGIAIDVITGGYPCQPFSQAGKRLGAEDDRHLWPEVARLLAELRPAWFIGENVAGHISMGLDNVLSDLEGQGYACRTFVIPACAVDAPHRRDRVWIVANAHRSGRAGWATKTGRETGAGAEGNRKPVLANAAQLHRNGSREYTQQGERQISQPQECCGASNVADADNQRSKKRYEKCAEQSEQKQASYVVSCSKAMADADQPRSQGHGRLCQCSGEWSIGAERRSKPGNWLPEPPVGRVANGVSNRVDRLKGLGNAVVPQIPEMIGRAILEANKYDR